MSLPVPTKTAAPPRRDRARPASSRPRRPSDWCTANRDACGTAPRCRRRPPGRCRKRRWWSRRSAWSEAWARWYRSRRRESARWQRRLLSSKFSLLPAHVSLLTSYPHLVARRADDRLDELVIRVFVAAADQLADPLPPVRSIVVAAGEIEQAERVVRRPDGENPDAFGGGGRIAHHGGFARLQVLAEPATAVETRRR